MHYLLPFYSRAQTMKRSPSNYGPSVRVTPYMAPYEPGYPDWAYRQVDTSPPPPYSSREGSQHSAPTAARVPVATSDRSQRIAGHSHARHHRQPRFVSLSIYWPSCRLIVSISASSTEYTPLLEDFTRKFVESQLSTTVPSNQQVHGSNSQLVPPELLVLCQQQSPYNPNFDSISTNSSTSSLTMSEFSRRNSASTGLPSATCSLLPAGRCSHQRWFASNFIFLFTLLAFNFGMLITPQFYSSFFLVFLNSSSTDTGHPRNILFFDLIISSLIQVLLMLLATGSGLILIYAASNLGTTLRKRFQLSLKYRIHVSNLTPFPWFTYEQIVFETLGAFYARLLSLILTAYLFGLSTLYVITLYDNLDMLLSLVTFDRIRQLFCDQQVWYLNHDFLVSIWLTICVLICFGVNSFRRQGKHHASLSLLKQLVSLFGFSAVVYLTFIVIYIFLTSNPSSQGHARNAKRMYSPPSSDKLVCLKADSTFDWACLNKNWILLISSVPLLIMPFHLNELLITLLYASQHNQQLPREASPTVETTAVFPSNQPASTNGAATTTNHQGPNSTSARRAAHRGTDRHLAGATFQHIPHRLNFGRQVEQVTEPMMLDDTIISPLLSESPSATRLTSLSSLFSRPLHSFASVRNLFVTVTFLACLLNIAVNVFVYISAYNTATSFEDETELGPVRELLSPRLHSRSPPRENLLSLDLNFLRNYLHVLEPTSEGKPDGKQSFQRYILIGASVFLLLKTTLTYLLLVFRATLAHQTLTSGMKNGNPFGDSRSGRCLSSLLFTSPFLVWNLLVLIFSLFLERSPSLLHFLLLVTCWLGCFLLFVYPGFILLYFSFQSMRKNSLVFTSSYALLSVVFKPLRWAKSCLLAALCLVVFGLCLLALGPYAYYSSSSTTLLSILPLITHANSTSLYCSSPFSSPAPLPFEHSFY